MWFALVPVVMGAGYVIKKLTDDPPNKKYPSWKGIAQAPGKQIEIEFKYLKVKGKEGEAKAEGTIGGKTFEAEGYFRLSGELKLEISVKGEGKGTINASISGPGTLTGEVKTKSLGALPFCLQMFPVNFCKLTRYERSELLIDYFPMHFSELKGNIWGCGMDSNGIYNIQGNEKTEDSQQKIEINIFYYQRFTLRLKGSRINSGKIGGVCDNLTGGKIPFELEILGHCPFTPNTLPKTERQPITVPAELRQFMVNPPPQQLPPPIQQVPPVLRPGGQMPSGPNVPYGVQPPRQNVPPISFQPQPQQRPGQFQQHQGGPVQRGPQQPQLGGAYRPPVSVQTPPPIVTIDMHQPANSKPLEGNTNYPSL